MNENDAGAGASPGSSEEAAGLLAACRAEMAKRIVGQRNMIDGLLAALVAGGHILLEGVPGLAKTLAVKSLAEITGMVFKRIQFTPDLLPADLTGTLIWEQEKGTFSVRRGPVFANVILADEINRAPAKVQSALLEAMEERQVTIGNDSLSLPDPFFVLATQNPIEHEGTYALPEAEMDRFFLKLLVSYPEPAEELEILGRIPPFAAGKAGAGHTEHGNAGTVPLSRILDTGSLAFLRSAADSIRIDDRILRYIVSLVTATRPNQTKAGPQGTKGVREGLYRYIAFGASPRASIALCRFSRITALMGGRSFVVPEDVKAAALPALRHRVALSYEAEADGLDADAVISRILSIVPIP
ncbi:MAG: AAA family ATPase [Treponema sp.]|jgi:MoxR-like ATPase|nr:AAA family ATPase [Treponema sp.]